MQHFCWHLRVYGGIEWVALARVLDRGRQLAVSRHWKFQKRVSVESVKVGERCVVAGQAM
jgi:hypothetical protein